LSWEAVAVDVPEVFFADAGGVSIAWTQFFGPGCPCGSTDGIQHGERFEVVLGS
jgi:hypothetical protein